MISYCEPPRYLECERLLFLIDESYEKDIRRHTRRDLLLKADAVGCFDGYVRHRPDNYKSGMLAPRGIRDRGYGKNSYQREVTGDYQGGAVLPGVLSRCREDDGREAGEGSAVRQWHGTCQAGQGAGSADRPHLTDSREAEGLGH